LRELGNGCALRPEETGEGQEPEPKGYRAGGGDRRDQVQVGYRDDEEEYEVATTEYAVEAGLLLSYWQGSSHLGYLPVFFCSGLN
jgi:hypothetical protein